MSMEGYLNYYIVVKKNVISSSTTGLGIPLIFLDAVFSSAKCNFWYVIEICSAWR